jgi:hypothetical protein
MSNETLFEIQSEPELLNDGYKQLKAAFEKDPTLFEQIEKYLAQINNPVNLPFLLIELYKVIFPKIIGKEATNFLFYILKNGLDSIDSLKFDYSSSFDLKIYTLVQIYGIDFVCNLKFIQNQLDFVTSQFMGISGKDEAMLRFIRADKENIIFNVNVETLINMSAKLINHLEFMIKVQNYEPDEKFQNLIYAIYKLMHTAGIANEEDEKDDGKDQ